MKLSAILAPLIAAGVSGDVILATVRAFEDERADLLEKRRESDRLRQAAKKSRDSREPSTKSRDRLLVTRGEDNSSTSEIPKKEKKEPSPSAQRGVRIPDDFSPDIQAAISEGLSRAEAEREARTFCDYWRARPGKEALKLDWPATWRIWFRKRVAEPPQQCSTPPPIRETVGSLSRKQLFERQDNAPDDTTGRVVQIDSRRLEEGPGSPRSFAVSGNLLGRF
jgi:hypothetical protein